MRAASLTALSWVRKPVRCPTAAEESSNADVNLQIDSKCKDGKRPWGSSHPSGRFLWTRACGAVRWRGHQGRRDLHGGPQATDRLIRWPVKWQFSLTVDCIEAGVREGGGVQFKAFGAEILECGRWQGKAYLRTCRR